MFRKPTAIAALAPALLVLAGPAVGQGPAQTPVQTSAQQPAPGSAQERAGHFEQGVWVPEGSTLAEVREQQAANTAQAEAARQQTDANVARQAAYAQALAAYEAELERLEQDRIAREAEAARVAAAHEAAMARWRADVAACESGDKSRCAPAD